MTGRRHPLTGKPIGSWQRGQGFRWWDGPCQCGSGLPGREMYDDNGIYYCISCVACNREPADGPYEEDIENDC
jgi:hypothetical protein